MQLHANTAFFAPPHERELCEQVLLALARARFVRATSLVSFATRIGLSADIVDRWHATGLVHRAPYRSDFIQGKDEDFVALTTRGARELANATGVALDGISSARLKVSSQKRAHDVGVGEVAIASLAAAHESLINLVGLETDDRKLISSVTIRDKKGRVENVGLQADGLVMTRTGKGASALAIEFDRGTTALARMERKYAGYLAWRERGGPEADYAVRAFRVLTIALDARRLEKLRSTALRAAQGRPSGFLLFALAEDFSVADLDRLLGPVARRVSAEPESGIPIFERSSELGSVPAAA